METKETNSHGEHTFEVSEQDRDFERFIRDLNKHLVPFEEDQYLDLEETLPSVHVIGVPRSGTTLMTQLICSYLDVGYINNLIARFWKAPVTGIRISRKLLGDNHESSLSSYYGKTYHIHEPHEFNFFWSDQLGYDELKVKSPKQAEKIDWEKVSHALKNIIHAFEKPVAFKSFVLGWHAGIMQQHLEKTCFVWIRRNPLDNALSLLETRDEYFGSRENWSTLKPKNYESLKDMTPYEQVAAQVYYMEHTYREQLDKLPESNYLTLQYEEVCKDPSSSLNAVRDMLNRHGGMVQLLNDEIAQLKPSVRSLSKSEDYQKTREALQALFHEPNVLSD